MVKDEIHDVMPYSDGDRNGMAALSCKGDPINL